jgi:hypothetical protein
MDSNKYSFRGLSFFEKKLKPRKLNGSDPTLAIGIITK